MGTYHKEGICVPIKGSEDDYLELNDDCDVGIVETVESAAGIEVPDWDVCFAAGRTDPFWAGVLTNYRQRSGRQWPPVVRVFITVEASPLSDEETERYWEQKRTESLKKG